MTKYSYKSEKDKQLIIKSFNNLAYLIFGKKNHKKIEAFKNLFESQVSEINIFPQNTVTEYLNENTPGICRSDESDKIIIEMLGYIDANNSQSNWIKHEGTHEFCHAFVDLLPMLLERNRKGIVKDGIRLRSYMGMIEETDSITGKKVGQHFYGKMFNETSMDIITSMAINCFDSNSSTSVDDILQNHYSNWGNETTGYSIFTSLTRLTIAAFSNNGFINYQQIVNSGESIFDINAKMNDGSTKKANDFLYGIVFDQLHIEEEFDKIMGSGYYKIFCEYLDRLFIITSKNQKIPAEDIKSIMNILPDFLNKKINYMRINGIIDVNSSNQIISNFNKIWNSMQIEYNAYFSQKDIDTIAKRAGRK